MTTEATRAIARFAAGADAAALYDQVLLQSSDDDNDYLTYSDGSVLVVPVDGEAYVR